jgi:hypothetical protein
MRLQLSAFLAIASASCFSDGDRLIELPMELGSGVAPDYECSDAVTCPHDGTGALSCFVDRGNQAWTFSYSCDANSAYVSARLFREHHDPADHFVTATADDAGRVLSVDVTLPAEGLVESYRYEWSSTGHIARSAATFRIDADATSLSWTNTIVFDAQGLPVQVTSSDDIAGAARLEWLEYDGRDPPRIVIRRFDFDADDDIDRVERYLYDDDGAIDEVVIELPGAEPEFIPVGNCCNEGCPGASDDDVEIIDPVRL